MGDIHANNPKPLAADHCSLSPPSSARPRNFSISSATRINILDSSLIRYPSSQRDHALHRDDSRRRKTILQSGHGRSLVVSPERYQARLLRRPARPLARERKEDPCVNDRRDDRRDGCCWKRPATEQSNRADSKASKQDTYRQTTSIPEDGRGRRRHCGPQSTENDDSYSVRPADGGCN